MSGGAPTWSEQNQRFLVASIDAVRAALERAAETTERVRAGGAAEIAADGGRSAAEIFRDAEARAAEGVLLTPPAALDTLAAAFRLTPFERRVVLLCAGVELVSSLGPLCAAAQGDPRRAYATFGLALDVLPDAHWSALAPASPLRRFRFVEVQHAGSLAQSPIRLEENVLHHLTGVGTVDERLACFLERMAAPAELAASHREIARKMAAAWSRARASGALPIVELAGVDQRAKPQIAAAAYAELGLGILCMRGGDIPAGAVEREQLATLWERQSVLSHAGLFVDLSASIAREQIPAAGWFVERVSGPVAVATDVPLRSLHRSSIRFEVDRAERVELRGLWESALGEEVGRFGGELDRVIAQFRVDAGRIEEAAEQALAAKAAHEADGAPRADQGASLVDPGEGAAPHLLWDTLRALTRGRLEEIAQRIDAVATWDDLVLPAPQLAVLCDIAVHVRRREKVYEQWGFGTKSNRGLGISALFSGPSGTGKTMAAEVLANELRLDLYRIDLSQVVSKYIGETEKNLRRAFDAAEEGGAILLFDEADALFGKRSEVKDSHDRYANIEVSYLLQRMEAYRGLAILTTNLKGALDQAFLRRIRFTMQFPFPDATQRAEIWRRVFPALAPTEGLDPGKLAQLNTSGGNIRNIAMNAAFFAAEAGQPVRMAHVLHAARVEYGKLEKPLTNAEIGGWV